MAADPRSDPTPEPILRLLDDLGWGGAERIGSGSGGLVFAVNVAQVVKVYRSGARREVAERSIAAFYEWLKGCGLPFETPVIDHIGGHNGLLYSVQRRMPGTRFTDLLPVLAGAERDRALRNYFAAVSAIGQVEPPGLAFGQLSRPQPRMTNTWQEQLRLQAEEAMNLDDLRSDVPLADVAIERAWAAVATIGEPANRSLVHGDYWPENVFLGDDLRVSAVIDWDWGTVAGDRRLDLASMSFFMESAPGFLPEDVTCLEELAVEVEGAEMRGVIAAYRAWFALAFSDCKHDDAASYAWSVENLARLVR